jgi:hypothetical protein
VAAGALWLAATIAVERRREGLVLLRARGASSTQLGALVGAQAALAAVPGAALGVLVALQVPGRSHAGDFVLPAVLTLGAVLLVVTAGAQVHAGRAHRGGRWRWVAEVLVVVAAVASLTVDPGSGTDPPCCARCWSPSPPPCSRCGWCRCRPGSRCAAPGARWAASSASRVRPACRWPASPPSPR